MNILIRKATLGDLKTIQNFTQRLNKDQHDTFDKSINSDFALSKSGKKYLQEVIDVNGVIFLAEKESIPIGYIVAVLESVGDFRLIDNYCEIDFMWVNKKYRNKEIGKRLMKKVEEWCRDKNIRRMRIVVDAANKKALKLYKSQLFKEYDIILEKDLIDRK